METFTKVTFGLVLCAIALWAVKSIVVPDAVPGDPNSVGGGITYFSDPNTDLCFASSSDTWRTNYSFTYVPCTEKVIKQVEKQQNNR